MIILGVLNFAQRLSFFMSNIGCFSVWNAFFIILFIWEADAKEPPLVKKGRVVLCVGVI